MFILPHWAIGPPKVRTTHTFAENDLLQLQGATVIPRGRKCVEVQGGNIGRYHSCIFRASCPRKTRCRCPPIMTSGPITAALYAVLTFQTTTSCNTAPLLLRLYIFTRTTHMHMHMPILFAATGAVDLSNNAPPPPARRRTTRMCARVFSTDVCCLSGRTCFAPSSRIVLSTHRNMALGIRWILSTCCRLPPRCS